MYYELVPTLDGIGIGLGLCYILLLMVISYLSLYPLFLMIMSIYISFTEKKLSKALDEYGEDGLKPYKQYFIVTSDRLITIFFIYTIYEYFFFTSKIDAQLENLSINIPLFIIAVIVTLLVREPYRLYKRYMWGKNILMDSIENEKDVNNRLLDFKKATYILSTYKGFWVKREDRQLDRYIIFMEKYMKSIHKGSKYPKDMDKIFVTQLIPIMYASNEIDWEEFKSFYKAEILPKLPINPFISKQKREEIVTEIYEMVKVEYNLNNKAIKKLVKDSTIL